MAKSRYAFLKICEVSSIEDSETESGAIISLANGRMLSVLESAGFYFEKITELIDNEDSDNHFVQVELRPTL